MKILNKRPSGQSTTFFFFRFWIFPSQKGEKKYWNKRYAEFYNYHKLKCAPIFFIRNAVGAEKAIYFHG